MQALKRFLACAVAASTLMAREITFKESLEYELRITSLAVGPGNNRPTSRENLMFLAQKFGKDAAELERALLEIARRGVEQSREGSTSGNVFASAIGAFSALNEVGNEKTLPEVVALYERASANFQRKVYADVLSLISRVSPETLRHQAEKMMVGSEMDQSIRQKLMALIELEELPASGGARALIGRKSVLTFLQEQYPSVSPSEAVSLDAFLVRYAEDFSASSMRRARLQELLRADNPRTREYARQALANLNR